MVTCWLLWLQYTFAELLDTVQASEGELYQALAYLNAVLINGNIIIACSCNIIPYSCNVVPCSCSVMRCGFS